ncbi:MAG TPA: mechanosensitive ion channel domain-containing protein [Kribbella sp.]|uniref:mechanosensitive ion channel family protein n=1 Tax=Kribbella sp. TaxID=1871183 RepID=UPI002D7659C2|nr:mechanosensitive ion channel domain-containing protein [Kribbella sp.]HET6295803.1 mechanosensitive ion channel domain-containing protein [Kribbella sp.]
MERGSQFVQSALALIATAAVAWLIAFTVERVVRRRHSRSAAPVWPSLRLRCRGPFRATLVIAALLTALPSVGLSDPLSQLGRQVLVLALIASVSWLIIRLTRVVEDVALTRLDIDVDDNRRARRLRTQVMVFRRVIVAMLMVVAVAVAVMTIPSARDLGASFLVSAGVLSVVAGLAAQSTISNLLAGLQIALSDPIRIDDVVVVDDEWGRVDEITLTYVVVRTWDNRRLILPISWFTTHVFQNWTRHEARVLGSIVLHVDFTTPVEELRTEMYRLVQASPLWDGRDWVLQVVDTTPSTMVVRGLVSSADAPSNWDLRCDVREKLLAFLQERHPGALPQVRADISSAGDPFRRTAADTTDNRSGPTWPDRSTADSKRGE